MARGGKETRNIMEEKHATCVHGQNYFFPYGVWPAAGPSVSEKHIKKHELRPGRHEIGHQGAVRWVLDGACEGS